MDIIITEPIGQEQYERELAETQRQHLQNVQCYQNNNWRPCMHDMCSDCHGTGVKINGGVCIHFISCPCPKCSHTC